jgi:tetratricopeptide (TPR) repeat protein
METAISQLRLRILTGAISLIGAFYCIYGILQSKGYIPHDYWAQSWSLSSRFVNSGPFGAFINLNIFLSLGVIFAQRNIFAKILNIFFLAVFFVSLILSKSRISWLAFALTVILFLVIFLRKSNLTVRKGIIFILIFGILILAFLRYKSLIWERIYTVIPTQFQSLFQRGDVWKGTARIIVHHPLGTGIGTFQYIYPTYRTHSDRFFIDYAHSDYLQMASDLGIIAMLIFCWFFLRLFRRSFRALSALPKQDFCMIIGLICAALSFTFQSIVDFPMQIPANAILFFTIIALLSRYTAADKPKIFLLRKSSVLIIAIMIIISALLYTSIYLSNKYYLLARGNITKMDLNEGITNYNKSIKLMPLNADGYAEKAGIYTLKATFAFGPQKINYRNEAFRNLRTAIRLNPHQSKYYLALASLYADEEKRKDAISAFKKAIEVNPTDGEFYYSYADYCLEHNLLDEALKIYRKSLSLFISDDGRFPKLYGSVQGLFDKIYRYTQEYAKLKQAVPDDPLYIRLAFAEFLWKKKMVAESLSEYQDILKRYPDNKTAKSFIEYLKKE